MFEFHGSHLESNLTIMESCFHETSSHLESTFAESLIQILEFKLMLRKIKVISQLQIISENERAMGPKERLNQALHKKLDENEIKKQRMIALDKKIAKLPDGSEKRKLTYQKQQQEEYQRKHKKSPIDEERNLHESYQILLRVSENRV